MAPPIITTRLAEESEVSTLASLITLAFTASDAAYPLIWGSAPLGTHELVATEGLLTPLQNEERATYVAVHTSNEQIVGFATWKLPNEKVSGSGGGGGLPDIPGVNMELFKEKINGTRDAYDRDVDTTKDLRLSLCFVHPDYHRKGVGSLLLQWGIQRASEAHEKIWLTSTPQAIRLYEKNKWEVKQLYEIDLGKHGGEGTYRRAWMLRLPESISP